jgi:pyruvate carboxylase
VISSHRISPHYDSLLVKCITHSPNFKLASMKMQRALREFRIRGVTTNIHFLLNVLEDKDFASGNLDTSFIDQRPHLFKPRWVRDRANRMLNYLGDIAVNGPSVSGAAAGVLSHGKYPNSQFSASVPGCLSGWIGEGVRNEFAWLIDRRIVSF